MELWEIHITFENSLKCQGGCLLDGCLLLILQGEDCLQHNSSVPCLPVEMLMSDIPRGELEEKVLRNCREKLTLEQKKTLFFFLPVWCFLSSNKS